MSAVPKPKRLTEEEYLRIERAAEYRSEFFRGEMFAMAGASHEHNVVKHNLERGLGNRLANGSCQAFSSDYRVKVPATGLFTYPDIGVFCGKPEMLDGHFDTLLNPRLIVEILSDSTANYDRGKKFAHYQSIPSLLEYVLVAQDEPRCESFLRLASGEWRYAAFVGLDAVLLLESLGVSIPLAEIYAKVEFPAADA